MDKTADSRIHVKVEVAELLGAEIMLCAQLNNQTFIAKVDVPIVIFKLDNPCG